MEILWEIIKTFLILSAISLVAWVLNKGLARLGIKLHDDE